MTSYRIRYRAPKSVCHIRSYERINILFTDASWQISIHSYMDSYTYRTEMLFDVAYLMGGKRQIKCNGFTVFDLLSYLFKIVAFSEN